MTFLELFEEIRVRAEVQGSLVLLVLDVQTGSIRDEEDGDGRTALLLCAGVHDGLGEWQGRGEGREGR